MRVLLLSDLHIAKSTPWSTSWEDMRYLVTALEKLKNQLSVPDAVIICGDTFNSPRVHQGDVVWYEQILNTLMVDCVCYWINGNHDPGPYNVTQLITEAVHLEPDPLKGMAGHDYSQNLEEVRAFLQASDAQITVTHQSASMFMNLGDIAGLDQLRPEDFHAPLNLIGDTHVTRVYENNGVVCISPGILCPMRSRKELFESDPKLVILDDGKSGSGDVLLDLDTTEVRAIDIPKRPHLQIESQEQLDDYMGHFKEIYCGVPVIGYVSAEVRHDLNVSKYNQAMLRLVEYATAADDVDIVYDVHDSPMDEPVDILVTAAELLPDDTPNKGELLSLTGDLLGTDAPEEIIKNYLEGK